MNGPQLRISPKSTAPRLLWPWIARSELKMIVPVDVANAMREQGPGGVAGVVHEGRVVAARAWGHADVETALPMARTLRLPICSISKQFTCAALLAGLLSHVGLYEERSREYTGARGARFAIWPGSASRRTACACCAASTRMPTETTSRTRTTATRTDSKKF